MFPISHTSLTSDRPSENITLPDDLLPMIALGFVIFVKLALMT